MKKIVQFSKTTAIKTIISRIEAEELKLDKEVEDLEDLGRVYWLKNEEVQEMSDKLYEKEVALNERIVKLIQEVGIEEVPEYILARCFSAICEEKNGVWVWRLPEKEELNELH